MPKQRRILHISPIFPQKGQISLKDSATGGAPFFCSGSRAAADGGTGAGLGQQAQATLFQGSAEAFKEIGGTGPRSWQYKAMVCWGGGTVDPVGTVGHARGGGTLFAG